MLRSIAALNGRRCFQGFHALRCVSKHEGVPGAPSSGLDVCRPKSCNDAEGPSSPSSVNYFTFAPAPPSYCGGVTERSVMMVDVLPSPAWAFPPSTWPRRAPPAGPFSWRRAAARAVGPSHLSSVMPAHSASEDARKRALMARASTSFVPQAKTWMASELGLARVRTITCRKSGTPDLR